jgi:hypothetical protein
MDERREHAVELMTRFGERTGLTSQRPPRRYLWTDAFAVCNFLALDRATGDSRHGELALRLVDGVHHVLGRHRGDDGRRGWISGLGDAQAEAHPTRAGLRIGKPLPERRPDQPMDERLEWDRDGQYFHYLTKWMHALDQVTRATGQPLFNEWARELAQAAHRAFTYAPAPGRPRRMYWKLSIDLSRPLVASMGQHDPLDGLVTCAQLSATAPGREPGLGAAIADFSAMLDPSGLASADPLGIGGLLVDAYRLDQLERQGAGSFGLLEILLDAGLVGLRHYAEHSDLHRPAAQRLAFRELGLAIGLAALARAEWQERGRSRIERLQRYLPLRGEIESFWLRREHRGVDSWLAHADINDVMLATSLEPQGVLVLPPVRADHART